MTYCSLRGPERTQIYTGTLCRDTDPCAWKENTRGAFFSASRRLEGLDRRREEKRGEERRGGQARSSWRHGKVHIWCPIRQRWNTASQGESLRTWLFFCFFDLLLFTTNRTTFCTVADRLIASLQDCSPTWKKHEFSRETSVRSRGWRLENASGLWWEGRAALCSQGRGVFSGAKWVISPLPYSLSIKRCSEALEGRLGDVRLWGFTHCTLCLWASALFECLRDRDGHFHSRHEINSLQPFARRWQRALLSSERHRDG